MDFEAGRVITQQKLAAEADTLAELLGTLRPYISTRLIGEQELGAILDSIGDLPATCAAFPFGFELPLNDPRPAADIGVAFSGGTMPAEYFRQRADSGRADRCVDAVMGLFGETDREDSPLRQVTSRKLMLEYDVASASGGSQEMPGIFLRPSERPMFAGRDCAGDIDTVIEALVAAAGWTPEAGEPHHATNAFHAMAGETRLDSIGVFPARERSIRLAITGFRNFAEILGFLERAKWPGSIPGLSSSIAQFEKLGGFKSLGAHLDVRADGLGPSLGLSFLNKNRLSNDPRYWLDDPADWNPFLDSLTALELALPEKLAALATWADKPAIIFGKAGPYVLLRGIHHIKLVVAEGRLTKAKGYVFMLVGSAQSF